MEALIVLLVLGVAGVAGALWYKNRKPKPEPIPEPTPEPEPEPEPEPPAPEPEPEPPSPPAPNPEPEPEPPAPEPPPPPPPSDEVNGWKIVGDAPLLRVTEVKRQDSGGIDVTILARPPAGELQTNIIMAYFVPAGEHPDRNPTYTFREKITPGGYRTVDGLPGWKYPAMDLFLRSERRTFLSKTASPWAFAEIRP